VVVGVGVVSACGIRVVSECGVGVLVVKYAALFGGWARAGSHVDCF